MFIYKILKFRKFSQSIINPYKLLNVDQNEEFINIKKKYLTLVKKYHPDKNNKNKELFISIKSAFEEIKQQRGLLVRKNYYTSNYKEKSEFKSKRPKYKYDEKKNINLNFEELYKKAESSDNYNDLKTSFDTLRSMEDKHFKFSTIDYIMPNSFKRFGIPNISCYIQSQSDSSITIYLKVIIVIVTILLLSVVGNNKIQKKSKNNAINNLKNEKNYIDNVIELKNNQYFVDDSILNDKLDTINKLNISKVNPNNIDNIPLLRDYIKHENIE